MLRALSVLLGALLCLWGSADAAYITRSGMLGAMQTFFDSASTQRIMSMCHTTYFKRDSGMNIEINNAKILYQESVVNGYNGNLTIKCSNIHNIIQYAYSKGYYRDSGGDSTRDYHAIDYYNGVLPATAACGNSDDPACDPINKVWRGAYNAQSAPALSPFGESLQLSCAKAGSTTSGGSTLDMISCSAPNVPYAMRTGWESISFHDIASSSSFYCRSTNFSGSLGNFDPNLGQKKRQMASNKIFYSFTAQAYNCAVLWTALDSVKDYNLIKPVFTYALQKAQVDPFFNAFLFGSFDSTDIQMIETAPPSGGGSTGGGTGTGTTTPPCTKPDGSTSGNPYDCAPVDNATQCTILDIPCNLRKFFVPQEDWQAKFQALYASTETKFPRAYFAWLDYGQTGAPNAYLGDVTAPDNETCGARIHFDVDHPLGGTVSAKGDLCDNAGYQWWDDHMRGWLTVIMWVLTTMGIFRAVSTS